MAIEEGFVIRAEGAIAWVKTRRRSACASCSARHSCVSLEGDGQDMEVEAINAAKAAIGDHVLVGIESAALLKATFMLYVFPIICLIAGAFAGNAAGPFFNIEGSSASVICAAGFFAISFLMIRYKANRMAESRHYRPRIIRIIKPAFHGPPKPMDHH